MQLSGEVFRLLKWRQNTGILKCENGLENWLSFVSQGYIKFSKDLDRTIHLPFSVFSIGKKAFDVGMRFETSFARLLFGAASLFVAIQDSAAYVLLTTANSFSALISSCRDSSGALDTCLGTRGVGRWNSTFVSDKVTLHPFILDNFPSNGWFSVCCLGPSNYYKQTKNS